MNINTVIKGIAGVGGVLYAVLATAGVLDGAEVRFRGYVTDEAPKWIWHIASPEQRWAVDTADARGEAGWLIFDLGHLGSRPFLEGRLHQLAARGGPGFSPQVTFSSAGHPFMLPQGGSLTAAQVRAAVPVRDPDSGEVVGQLRFTLVQGLAASVGTQAAGASLIPPGMALLLGGSITRRASSAAFDALQGRLSALLQMTPGFGHGMSAASNGRVLPQSLLADGGVMHIAAAYASALSDFELRLAASPPAQWRAALSVTVTVH